MPISVSACAAPSCGEQSKKRTPASTNTHASTCSLAEGCTHRDLIWIVYFNAVFDDRVALHPSPCMQATMQDMLAVERQLAEEEAGVHHGYENMSHDEDISSMAGISMAEAHPDEHTADHSDQHPNFHAKKKSSTLTKYYKKLVKPIVKPKGAGAGALSASASAPPSPLAASARCPPSATPSQLTDSSIALERPSISGGGPPPAAHGGGASASRQGAGGVELEDDADSMAAASEFDARGGGSRLSFRAYEPGRQESSQHGAGYAYSMAGSSVYGGDDNRMGSLKNYFGKKKKSKQIELDAIR